MTRIRLDPEILLDAYCRGVFPMADHDGQIRWYTADPRGIIPLDAFHLPGSLAQFMRSDSYPFEVRINHDFERAMRACMEARPGATWISRELIRAYTRLHEMGFAHSVETWMDGKLVGGLYCVALGRAVFGESMFSMVPDASKIALAALVAFCRHHGIAQIDCQQNTAHLASLGATEVPRSVFLLQMQQAQSDPAVDWRFSPLYWDHILSA